jgi:TetR/AcrR family transcriptional regulator
MSEEEKNTEKTILDAAKKVFLARGFDGARMQQIADEAKINKSLVHYYFRSKDKLFNAIFAEAFGQFIPKVAETMASDKDIFEKIRVFTETYIEMFIKNPHIPTFVLHEINRNPERIVGFFKESNIDPSQFAASIINEIQKGTIKAVNPLHLIINMISMCVFPFAAKPILKGFIFNNDEEMYMSFIEERKKEVSEFIINSIKK